MEIIYLNSDEFESFIEKKYVLAQSAHKKPGAKKFYSITVRQLIPYGKNFLVLLSMVDAIHVPDANRIPQLKTLYGIPAGLITVDEIMLPKKLAASNPIPLTEDDLLFRAFRRALMFVHVWGIKGLELDAVKIGIQPLLDPKKLTLLKLWVADLLLHGKYPEAKKLTASIDDTVFDKQFIGLGKFLKNQLFPDDEVMDEEHRHWLFGLREAKLDATPAKFEGLEPLLAGYLIALKASNENKKNLAFIIDKTSKFQLTDPKEKYAYIMSALFFVGVFESKADQYFMAASAAGLYASIERFAFSLVFQSAESNFFDNDYVSIRDAILDPVPNCIEYYKLKNPAIKNDGIFEFGNHTTFEYPEKVAVLRPHQAIEFIEQQQAIYPLMDQYQEKLCVTDDKDFFETMRRNKIPVVLYEKGGYLWGQFGVKSTTKILATSPALKRAIALFFKPRQAAETENFEGIGKNWLLILNEYHLGKFEKYLIKRAFQAKKPDTITVFNTATKKVEVLQELQFEASYKAKGKGAYGNYKPSTNTMAEYGNSNASLQNDMELLCPDVPCRIITKYHTDKPWEMVQLGIGALQNVDFKDCSLLDLRIDKSEKAIYEYILRCFRDVIVYDNNQRYMFMNL